MAEKFIKRYHKKYISNNNYYNDKYFYNFNNNNIFYKKNICNKYDDITIDEEYFVCKVYCENTKNLIYHKFYFNNNEIYIDNEFFIIFFNNYIFYENLQFNNFPYFYCKKIIINYDYKYIKKYLKQYIINNNKTYDKDYYKSIIKTFSRLCFEGNIIILENGYFNEIKCNNFICNYNQKYDKYFDKIKCKNFIINNELFNINKLNLINKYIINSNFNESNKFNIKILKYYNNNLTQLNTLTKIYNIFKLYLYNDNITLYDFNNINIIYINNIYYDNNYINNIYLQNHPLTSITLLDNIYNNKLIINLNVNKNLILNLNNYKINRLQIIVDNDNINLINNLINKLLINNSLNELTITFSFNVMINLNNFIIDFKNLKLNILKIYYNFKFINFNNINEIIFIHNNFFYN